jgi:hypothetical protein
MPYVYLDVHKDIEAWYSGDVHRHKARMPIVDQQVSFQRPSAEVIDAAGAICDISQDEAVLSTSKAAGSKSKCQQMHSKGSSQ